MQVSTVQFMAGFAGARGIIGQKHPIIDDAERVIFGRQLAEHTHTLTKSNTADCGDERRTVSLADGTEDALVLQKRIVPQLFGGLILSTTKALIGANALLTRDAKSFQTAYEKVATTLSDMGFEDGGHQGCGASKTVESSIGSALAVDALQAGVTLFKPSLGADRQLASDIHRNNDQRLQDGFFGLWSNSWHEDFLRTRYPQNFSLLDEGAPDDHLLHGHNGRGIYVVTADGQGFAKNEFIERTANQSFAVTRPTMQDLALRLGGSEAERRAIEFGFYADTLNVGAGLVTDGMPIFA